MDVRFDTNIRIVILFMLPSLYITQENICPTSSGEKVVHVCERSFASGTSIYLDTFKAVDYQGSCTCSLRAQGGAVDFQLSVQGVHADCDATLYVPPPIDHTYNCVDKTPSTTTGRIESGRTLFVSLTKNSDVADFCVHLVQTSTAGSLNVACNQGTLKPTTITTTTITPPAVTSSTTTSIGPSTANPVNTVTESKDQSTASPENTVTENKEQPPATVTENKDQPTASPDNTRTESKDQSTTSPENTMTESKDQSTASPDNTRTESKDQSTASPENTMTESKDQSTASPDNTRTESKDQSTASPENTMTESKDQSTASPDNTRTESKDQSTASPENTMTETKDQSTASPDDRVTEGKVSSGDNQNITPSGRTGADNGETPQSVIVVSFVVVAVFAAAVVVMILFGLFTYCRDKSRLQKIRAAQNLPNGHTTV